MLQANYQTETNKYARCIEVSKRIRWDIEEDVIRGRKLDTQQHYLPDTISRINELDFLSAQSKRFLSQIQGRTYANMFGLVERFINSKILEVSADHHFGDQVALEALVRFSDEELKHQALFRRIEALAGEAMPEGYEFLHQADEVASVVMEKSSWSVLALTCHIELFTQAHYRQSIEPDNKLSPLFKDVFLFHWQEESQHAIIDELEWIREDKKLNDAQRDTAVDDLIALVGAVDSILQVQAKADVSYFCKVNNEMLSSEQCDKVHKTVLAAYRWQYIVSGVEQVRFIKVLSSLINEKQMTRITQALQPIMENCK